MHAARLTLTLTLSTALAASRLDALELPVPAGEPRAQVCATNVAFGDRDSRTLYITACEHVYRIRMNAAGVHPAAARR